MPGNHDDVPALITWRQQHATIEVRGSPLQAEFTLIAPAPAFRF
jgi:hypothetical protein